MSAPAGPDRLVDFVVVGAQRAASTHLNRALADHPQIFMCPDEVPFFESPFFENSPPSALERVFEHAAPGAKRGIQRPEYLGRTECAANIHSLAPEARIIAVLRDPVARAVSAYFWYVQFRLLPLLPLNEGMEMLLEGELDAPRAGEVLDFGFYGRHLERYFGLFARDQVLVLLGDDLSDPTSLSSVYGFVGVDPNHLPTSLERPTNAGVYDRRRLRVLRARAPLAWDWDSVTEYEYKPRRLRRPAASAIAAAIVAVDRGVLSRVFTSERPALDPKIEQRLRAIYDPDLAVLEKMIERDLTAWRTTKSEAPGSSAHGTEAREPS